MKLVFSAVRCYSGILPISGQSSHFAAPPPQKKKKKKHTHTRENQWFSGVFRGCKIRRLTRNGLIFM